MKKTFGMLSLAIGLTLPSVQANLLSNPGFDQPPATADFVGSDWTAEGSNIPERQWWAARSGDSVTNRGVAVPGWLGPGDSAVYQDVNVSTGTYTFSIWVRQEQGFMSLSNKVMIEWYDADTNLLQVTEESFDNMVSDDIWHQLYVTGACDSNDLAFARARFHTFYDTPGASDLAAFVDDAAFYAGEYQAMPLANVSFERPGIDADGYWRNSKWNNFPESGSGSYYAFESWGARSGAWGVGLWGWEVAEPSNSVTLIQNNVRGPGTYTFLAHLNRENDFMLSNAQLRIEWYDRTFTNKLQADTVTNLTVPADFNWNEYQVTGTCLSNELYEVRVGIYVEWAENNDTNAPNRAMKIDDVRLIPGAYDGSSISDDWSYHGADSGQNSIEEVPGTNVGAFLQVDYASSTVTVYVMTPADGFALYDGESEFVGLRTSFQRPEDGSFVTDFRPMTPMGVVEIDSGSPFRGQPAVGVQTQMLWSIGFEFPRDTNDVIYTTNTITIFYAPYLRTTNEAGGETDVRYLVASDGAATNELDQLFAEAPENRDYTLLLNPMPNAVLEDPSFEIPADATDFAGSPWTAFGNSARDIWATRLGERGAYQPSWAAGSGGFYQDITATGGTYTATIWIKRMLGANVNTSELKIEWFNSAAQKMHEDVNTQIVPADELWHRLYVTSTLPAGEALFARVVYFTDYSAGSFAFHEAILLDEAEFYEGPFASEQAFMNGGFEMGTNGFADSYWDGVLTDWVGRDTWAALNGTWGGDFRGFVTGQSNYTATLSQSLNVSTGTYAFGAWLQFEDSILLTNAELRIEWVKDDFTDAQPATVVTLAPPLDNNWYYYEITGTCSAADLYEVRPTILAQWNENTNAGLKAVKIDDVFFGAPGLGDSDGDSLPDWWEIQYFGGPTNADATANSDGDDALNWEEYIADTNPTNTASYFPNIITNAAPGGTLDLVIGPPTTNSRVYEVWMNADLSSGLWMPLGYDIPGQNDGSAIIVTVTNGMDAANYATGVKLP